MNAFAERVGESFGPSRWFALDQSRIDAFAAVCEDRQFLHVDPEQAAASPFGGTIAHGFLTLSMLSAMAYDAMPPFDDVAFSVNYGFDGIRFLAPVPAGAKVRGRFTLTAAQERVPGEVTLTWDTLVEAEGLDRPALAAVWINRRYLAA